MASFSALDNIGPNLIGMGFIITSQATVVSDAKFWNRTIYRNQKESISISNEVGDALHLRDPIITLCAYQKTIDEVKKALL